jgi:hypothetical protein
MQSVLDYNGVQHSPAVIKNIYKIIGAILGEGGGGTKEANTPPQIFLYLRKFSVGN